MVVLKLNSSLYFMNCRVIRLLVHIVVLKYVGGLNLNSEDVEVVISTPFMESRVTGEYFVVIEWTYYKDECFSLLFSLHYCNKHLKLSLFMETGAWKQHQVWHVQINVSSVGDITLTLLEKAGSGRWMTL